MEKWNYQARQNLAFQAETPNFLKILRGEQGQEDEEKKSRLKEEALNRRIQDDEAPLYVLEEGVTATEAQLVLGLDEKNHIVSVKDIQGDHVQETRKKSKAESKFDKIVKSKRPVLVAEPTGPKSKISGLTTDDSKKRKQGKEKPLERETKKVKNKQLLSFDDADE